MRRRTERVSSLIRDVLGQILLSKISDPRIDPARTSVTRVEMPEDLMTAKVYISILGTESQQRNGLRALQHASGHIQELLMRQISLRNTPILDFVDDKKFKQTLQTYQIIQQAMDELEQKDKAKQEGQAQDDDQPATDESPSDTTQERQE